MKTHGMLRLPMSAEIVPLGCISCMSMRWCYAYPLHLQAFIPTQALQKRSHSVSLWLLMVNEPLLWKPTQIHIVGTILPLIFIIISYSHIMTFDSSSHFILCNNIIYSQHHGLHSNDKTRDKTRKTLCEFRDSAMSCLRTSSERHGLACVSWQVQ